MRPRPTAAATATSAPTRRSSSRTTPRPRTRTTRWSPRVEEPLSGADPSDPGTPADGADDDELLGKIKTNPGKWFKPAGCITTTLAANVATHLFNGCSGPYGLANFNGHRHLDLRPRKRLADGHARGDGLQGQRRRDQRQARRRLHAERLGHHEAPHRRVDRHDEERQGVRSHGRLHGDVGLVHEVRHARRQRTDDGREPRIFAHHHRLQALRDRQPRLPRERHDRARAHEGLWRQRQRHDRVPRRPRLHDHRTAGRQGHARAGVHSVLMGTSGPPPRSARSLPQGESALRADRRAQRTPFLVIRR